MRNHSWHQLSKIWGEITAKNEVCITEELQLHSIGYPLRFQPEENGDLGVFLFFLFQCRLSDKRTYHDGGKRGVF